MHGTEQLVEQIELFKQLAQQLVELELVEQLVELFVVNLAGGAGGASASAGGTGFESSR
jgi:hypothetical protein